MKDLLGSELVLCALEEHPQLSLDDALLLLWREMRLTNKLLRRDCNVKKFSSTTLSWTDNNDYPTLHSLVKGSQCKSIFMWLSRRSSQRLIPSQASELQRLRATALWSLRRFVDVCDSGGLFLTVEATTDACSAGWLFLRSYQKLAASTFTQHSPFTNSGRNYIFLVTSCLISSKAVRTLRYMSFLRKRTLCRKLG